MSPFRCWNQETLPVLGKGSTRPSGAPQDCKTHYHYYLRVAAAGKQCSCLMLSRSTPTASEARWLPDSATSMARAQMRGVVA